LTLFDRRENSRELHVCLIAVGLIAESIRHEDEILRAQIALPFITAIDVSDASLSGVTRSASARRLASACDSGAMSSSPR
jgi:hypothetical protein